MIRSIGFAAEVKRLHFVEKWPIGTIAAQLQVHPDVVRRILGVARPRALGAHRWRTLDQYRRLVQETLHDYPRLRATRLHEMLIERGYRGSIRSVRNYIAECRETEREPSFNAQPGESGLLYFDHVPGRSASAGRSNSVVFTLLSYSNATWAELVLDLSHTSLSRALVRSAVHFGGSPRIWWFYSSRFAVLDRYASAARFQDAIVDVCSRLGARPQLLAVEAPRARPLVHQRLILLRSYFATHGATDNLVQANAELERYLEATAHHSPHPRQHAQTVAQLWAQERPFLLPLPEPLPTVEAWLVVHVSRSGRARFDANWYQLPDGYERRTLRLSCCDRLVRLWDGPRQVASFRRAWGRGELVQAIEELP
jgi:hypothetical protein